MPRWNRSHWFLLWVCLSSTTHGHEMWIERRDERDVLLTGHAAHSHGPVEAIPVAAERVERADCFDADGPRRGSAWPTDGTCAGLVVTLRGSYWSKTPWGLKNLPRDEVEGAVDSWLSEETVKRLNRWSSALATSLTPRLEIVPAANPFTLRPGRKLKVLVRRNGVPVVGAPVSYDGDTRGETDAEGAVNIRLRHGGLQILQTSFSEPMTSPHADRIVRAATLVFEIPSGE